MSARLFPFWWLVAPEVVDIFTVYTYEIDGSFADGASLISGPIVIDGLFLMMVQSATQGDDDDDDVGITINGVDCVGTYVRADGGTEGLYASYDPDAGYFAYGILQSLVNNGVDVPHTSFDVKNQAGSTKTIHRTIKVVVLNRQGT